MTTSTPAAATRGAGPGPGRRSAPPTNRLVAVAGLVTIAGVAALVAWLRLPATARGTLWAEDGRVFVQQRVADGPFATWFVPYDGYLHVVPRVVADLVVSWLPVELIAPGVTVCACLVAGVVAAGVWICSRDLVASRATRLALASVTVLVPLAPLEVSGNLANLHWYLLWFTPFLLLHRTRGGRSTVLASVAALLIGLTEIQAVVFVPLVGAVLVAGRREVGARRRLVPSVVLSAALVVQVVVAAVTPRADAAGVASTVPQVVLGYLSSVVLGTVVPSASAIGGLLDRGGWFVALGATVPFVAAAVVVWRAFRRATPRGADATRTGDPAALDRFVLASVSALSSVTLWSLDVVVNHGPDTRFWFDDPGRVAELGLTRYAVVPSMFLLVVVLCAVDVFWRSPSRRLRVTGVVCWALAIVVAVAWFVGPTSARAAGPGWDGSLDRARDTCDAGATVAEVAGAPSGWGVLLPCEIVDQAP